jgi:hypothetical protein
VIPLVVQANLDVQRHRLKDCGAGVFCFSSQLLRIPRGVVGQTLKSISEKTAVPLKEE